MRFMYDARSPRQRGIVPDERVATHRAELRSLQGERRDTLPAPRRSRWWSRVAIDRPQTQDLGLRVIELQHRVEHLERRLRTISQRCPSS